MNWKDSLNAMSFDCSHGTPSVSRSGLGNHAHAQLSRSTPINFIAGTSCPLPIPLVVHARARPLGSESYSCVVFPFLNLICLLSICL